MDKREKGGEEVLQIGVVEHAFQWRQLEPSEGMKVVQNLGKVLGCKNLEYFMYKGDL